jgi:hypothetical protein
VVAHRASPFLGQSLNDGRYVLAWPAAANAPVILLTAGLVLGWRHPWPVFSYSLFGMAVMIAIATLGAAFGAWIWLGYIVSDFILAPHPPQLGYGNVASRFLHVRLPLLIGYAVLAFALVFVPLASRRFRDRAWAWGGHRVNATGLREALAALPAAALVFGWTLVAPLLIRPVVAWDHEGVGRFSRYPIEAFRPLQHWGWVLAVVAAAAAAGRVWLEHMARRRPGFSERVRPRLKPQSRVRPPVRLPVYVLVPLQAALATFFFSGLATDLSEALILGSIFVLVIVARGVIARTPAIVSGVTRVPFAVRLAVSGVVSFLLGCLIMRGTLEDAPGFLPLIYALGASLLFSAVLLPPGRATHVRTSPEARRVG